MHALMQVKQCTCSRWCHPQPSHLQGSGMPCSVMMTHGLFPGVGRLPREGWWLAAEASALVAAASAAAWAQLRRDIRFVAAAVVLGSGGVTLIALHERARRLVSNV